MPVPSLDPYAALVKASGSIVHQGRQIRVDLLIRDAEAAVRIRTGQKVEIRPITTSSTAISLLLDRRLAFLWSALLEWGGPDLSKFRASSVGIAETAYNAGRLMAQPRTTAESSTRPRTRQLFQYSEALWFAGYRDKARALVDTARAETGWKPGWQRTEWTMLSARLASLINNEGRHDEAIDLLIAAKATLGSDSPDAINFDINRAAYLAEAGRSAEALTLIEALEARFVAHKDGKYGGGNEKVPGSERQFAWIRACALSGLGRTDEAQRPSRRCWTDVSLPISVFVVPANAQVRQRAYVCMKDADGVVRELVEEMEQMPIFPRALFWMTPRRRRSAWIRQRWPRSALIRGWWRRSPAGCARFPPRWSRQ